MAPLCGALSSSVMPRRSPALSALIAAAIAMALGVGVMLWDISSDPSGEAGDAAAKEAAAAPLLLAVFFGFFWVLGHALRTHAPRYMRAVLLTIMAAFALLAVPAAVSIPHSGDSLVAGSTYVPWAVGFAALLGVLLPGSFVQALLLVPRHNKSLERSRDR